MHLALHPAFQGLDEESFAEHSEHVEHALHAHQRGNHLFCLRPAETQRILSELRLGPVASRTLSIIERRFQDYLGSYRRSARVVRLAPLRLSNTIIAGPSETLLAAEDLIEFLEFAPAFYVENGYNDGIFYKHIISLYLKREIGSSDFVNIRPFHGGGNSLGDALRQAVGRRAVGMCICDRDTCRLVPPLSSHSSAARAFASLCDLGVCTGAGIPNDQLPRFYFDVTAGGQSKTSFGPTCWIFFLT